MLIFSYPKGFVNSQEETSTPKAIEIVPVGTQVTTLTVYRVLNRGSAQTTPSPVHTSFKAGAFLVAP